MTGKLICNIQGVQKSFSFLCDFWLYFVLCHFGCTWRNISMNGSKTSPAWDNISQSHGFPKVLWLGKIKDSPPKASCCAWLTAGWFKLPAAASNYLESLRNTRNHRNSRCQQDSFEMIIFFPSPSNYCALHGLNKGWGFWFFFSPQL